MPLFGHHNQAPSGMRENEQVLGKWRTHHGDMELTNQRVLLMKSAGGLGMVEGKHEIAWGVDLDRIESIQVVGGGGQMAQDAANQAGSVATSNAPVSGLGNPLGALHLGQSTTLMINGQNFGFHEAGHANQAMAQIQSAIETRKKQLGQA